MTAKRAGRGRPLLITTARFSKSLDADQRRTRYLWTMAARVICFLAATMTPLPWNLLLLGAAAILPTLAVMLANAIDLRRPAEPPTLEPAAPHPALASPNTLPGAVEEES